MVQEGILRWRYRHLPGPRQKVLTGNLSEVLKDGLLKTIDGWISKHGDLVAFRLMSRQFVIVADPDAVRSILYKVTNHAPLSNPNAHLVTGDLRSLELYGLVTAMDEYWRRVRNAWQPAFAPASLRNYQLLMDREALGLARRLEAVAASAEGSDSDGTTGGRERRNGGGAAAAGAMGPVANGSSNSGGSAGRESNEVEFWSEMSRVTLGVVGTSAYGVDFNSQEYGGSDCGGSMLPTTGAPELAASRPTATAAAREATVAVGRSRQELSLVGACNDWFRTMNPGRRSKWAVATALPCVLPIVRHLASALPDETLAVHIQARRVLRKTSQSLMEGWRTRRRQEQGPQHQEKQQEQYPQAEEQGPANGGSKWEEGATGACTRDIAASAAATAGATAAAGAGGAGVAPGSFLGLMLDARDKSSGKGLSDAEIDAQVQTFMLAGFESTANAVTFAVYLLALHPDKAERLEREVDGLLPPPPLSEEEEEAPLDVELLDKLVYTEAVIQEAMRLYPPAHATTRLTSKPIKVLGYDIPAGTTFWIPIYHLHRKDPLWPDPGAFRPERFLPDGGAESSNGPEGSAAAAPVAGGKVGSERSRSVSSAVNGGTGGGESLAARHPHAHLPFGSGTRMCIGWRFAMQEAKTVLARLCQRVHFELMPGQVPLELVPGITLAPKHGVFVRVHRRRV